MYMDKKLKRKLMVFFALYDYMEGGGVAPLILNFGEQCFNF